MLVSASVDSCKFLAQVLVAQKCGVVHDVTGLRFIAALLSDGQFRVSADFFGG